TPAPTTLHVAGGGYFTMLSLTNLGLPTPVELRDLSALIEILLQKIDEVLDEAKLNESLIQEEKVETSLLLYEYIRKELQPFLEGRVEFLESEEEYYTDNLKDLKKERTDLQKKRAEYVETLENTNKESVKDDMRALIATTDTRLKTVNQTITGVENYLPKVKAEIAEHQATLDVLESYIVYVHSMFVRERSQVNNDTSSANDIVEQRIEELRDELLSRPNLPGVSDDLMKKLLQNADMSKEQPRTDETEIIVRLAALIK